MSKQAFSSLKCAKCDDVRRAVTYYRCQVASHRICDDCVIKKKGVYPTAQVSTELRYGMKTIVLLGFEACPVCSNKAAKDEETTSRIAQYPNEDYACKYKMKFGCAFRDIGEDLDFHEATCIYRCVKCREFPSLGDVFKCNSPMERHVICQECKNSSMVCEL